MHHAISEFQISVNHVLRFDSKQTFHKLFQNQSCLVFCQMSIPRFQESFDISTIAILHNQIVVCGSLGPSNQSDHVIVLYLSHNLDFIDQKLVIFTTNALSIYYFDCIDLLWIVLQVANMHLSVLSLS